MRLADDAAVEAGGGGGGGGGAGVTGFCPGGTDLLAPLAGGTPCKLPPALVKILRILFVISSVDGMRGFLTAPGS